MVDTGDLKSPAERRTGSSPVKRTLARLAKLVKANALEALMYRFESCIWYTSPCGETVNTADSKPVS